MDKQVFRELRGVTLLSALPAAVLADVAQVAIRRTYAAGELLFLAGARCEAAYLLVTGQVSVYRLSPEGRRQVLVQLGPGDAFNTVPPFLPEPRNEASAEALTDVVLYALLREEYVRLVTRHAPLAVAFLQDFAARLHHLTGLVEDLALYSVRARLARFLLEQEAAHPPARWTHEEMAAHIGTVREVVSRTLRAFVKEGLLKAERQRITVVDRAALKREAEV